MLTNQFLFLFIFLSYFVAHNEKFKEINQVNLFFSARMRVQKIVKHNLLVGHISQSFIISWRFKLLDINCNQRAESERIFCRSLFLFFLELSCSCFDCALKSFPTSHRTSTSGGHGKYYCCCMKIPFFSSRHCRGKWKGINEN